MLRREVNIFYSRQENKYAEKFKKVLYYQNGITMT